MTKPDLLKHIAETGYNVGYGAKMHFATYDLVSKMPSLISFLTFAVGLFFLLLDFTAKRYFSAACIVLGVLGLRISMWDHKKDEYSKAGVNLTGLFNRLKELYFQVKGSDAEDLSLFEEQLSTLQNEYNGMCLSNQMFLSDWYAHYKLFWQQQIGWIDEQLKFRLFRDKLPLSFTAAVVVFIVCVVVLVWYLV